MAAELQERVRIIAEALPFIRRYRGKRVLVKIGGAALTERELLQAFARDVGLLSAVGIGIVVVHGGGPQIGTELERAGIEERKVRGIRVTDEATLEVVERVLFGEVNRDIVAALREAGAQAEGLSGREGHLVRAQRKEDPETDYGLVGTVTSVNPASVNALADGVVPVVAPLGSGPDGKALNINADETAAAMAVALGCEALLMLTDTDGVQGSDGRTVEDLSVDEAERLVADGVIEGGMLPKVACALSAVEGGVPSGRILKGGRPHALLLELLTDQGAGTMIHAKIQG